MEALVCPACRGEYLHHFQLEAFERSEDAETGTHVSVTAGRYTTKWQILGDDFNNNSLSPIVIIDEKMDGNPSSRRQGLVIRFLCEDCSHISELRISQHKGSSLMSFV